MKHKKILAALLTAAFAVTLTVGLTGCSDNQEPNTPPNQNQGQNNGNTTPNDNENAGGNTGTVAPITNIEELGARLGYTVNAPTYMPSDELISGVMIIGDDIGEVNYSGDNEMTYRVRKGDMDISNVVSGMKDSKETTIKETAVTCYLADGKVKAASWKTESTDEFSHFIYFPNGLAEEEAIKVIESTFPA